MPIPGASGPTSWEAAAMPENACPQCGEEFEVIWGVSIGDAGNYRPVFGGPVAFDKARCDRCHFTFERSANGPWRREGAQ